MNSSNRRRSGRYSFLLLLALAVSLPTLLLFSKPKTPTPAPKPTPKPTASPTPAADQFTLPDPVARINGEPIKREDLERTAELLVASSGKDIKTLSAAEKKRLYHNVLDSIINERLVSAQAVNETVNPMDVEKRFAELRAQYPSQEAFDNDLKKSGQTPEQVRQSLRSQIARQQWVERQISGQVKITPEEVEKFYKEGPPDKFDTPEAVQASHILVAVRRDAAPEEALAAEKKANDIIERLKKGEKFADVARQVSDDQATRNNGGELGYFSRDRIMPAFADAAFKLKVGEISAPVRTQFGYHIILVTDHRAPKTASLDEARDAIVTFLTQQRREAAAAKLVQDLHDNAKIENLLPQ